ncbi:hypothetical protein JQK15_15990 [Sphingobium sp. BHU LFT2]|uniref:hypothetical protein n=1 Tax=Sphingobium sp. BHU LFT2 TaxID=2807634 RepID=UPI001BEA979F|nr:hypothetical protein [Sphingobium sp. BHU LFT2]MBT2245040.1 hypothetical protein [Sphingobium sp. BHU LFT2]
MIVKFWMAVLPGIVGNSSTGAEIVFDRAVTIFSGKLPAPSEPVLRPDLFAMFYPALLSVRIAELSGQKPNLCHFENGLRAAARGARQHNATLWLRSLLMLRGPTNAEGIHMTNDTDQGGKNRGRRPPEGSGEVKGSGAGAGGGGNPEDFDSDPAGGSDAAPTTPKKAEGDDDIAPPTKGSPAG